MGKYLDLAKKVEEQRREDIPTTNAEPLAPGAQYRKMATGLARDCIAIDPHWLIDTHPDLWLRLVDLDHEATRLEQLEESSYTYQQVLAEIAATIAKARGLYDTEGNSRLPATDSRKQ